MKEKDVYYVHVKSSHDLRRGILETSKQVIECLHRHERFKKMRAERIRAVEDLIGTFREINDLSAQMKIEMPKVKLPKPPKPEVAESPVKKFEHESDDELKKLEEAISQIENRLTEIK